MIVENGKYYLYRHIRLDKNEPFYIGIGTKSKKDINSIKHHVIYRRSYDKTKRRNKIWKDIIDKTDYEVEILLESDDYEFIKKKEIEFIKLYGRRDLGTGTLANLTDGGEGSRNRLFSKERNKKISEKNKGRVKSKEERLKLSYNNRKKVVNKITNEIFGSIKEAAKSENMTYSALSQQLWSNSKFCKFAYFEKLKMKN